MSLDVIKSITGTEEEAESVRKKALGTALEIENDARKQAAELINTAIDNARSRAAEFLSMAGHEAAEKTGVIGTEIEAECDRLRQEAMKSFDKAVALVRERIVSAG